MLITDAPVQLEAARAHPERFAAMGRLSLDDAKSAGAIAAWRAQPGMLGFRYSVHRPAIAHLLADDRVEWLWTACEKADVPMTHGSWAGH
jgi:hypothetical protein